MRGVSNGGKWSKAADKRRKKKKAIAITFPTRGTVLKTRSFTNPAASYAARGAWDSGTSLSGNDGRYVGRRCQTIREAIGGGGEVRSRLNGPRSSKKIRDSAALFAAASRLLLLLERDTLSSAR